MESTALQSENTLLYPLDQNEFTVEIKAFGGVICSHRLRKPTAKEAIERDSSAIYEAEEGDEGRIYNIDDQQANGNLWDKIALKIKGYKVDGSSAGDWIDVSAKAKEKIPANHKAAAIRAHYDDQYALELSAEEAFDLDREIYTIKQEITGGYVIRHTLKCPGEPDRQLFKNKFSRTMLISGERTKSRWITKTQIAVDLYDKLFISIDGVTDANSALKQIDPIWKRIVVVELMKVFESNALD
jgi:hypothetical protein